MKLLTACLIVMSVTATAVTASDEIAAPTRPTDPPSSSRSASPSRPSPAASPSNVRSIREWVSCDRTKDEAPRVAAAFAAARNDAFTLRVDCPVFIHVGMDISRPIFVDSQTSVEFSREGLFITDNVMIPTFVIANSTSVRFWDWRVEYQGGMPVDPATRGYYDKGTFVPSSARFAPAAAFNDQVMTQWLATNRGIVFDRSKGRVTTPWPGPVDVSAIFYFSGSTTNVEVKDFKLYVPPSAGAHRFIPICFSSYFGFKSNQTVTVETQFNSTHMAVPSAIKFSEIDLDGYYFGWQGKFQNSVFEHIRAHRYGDLQNANGDEVGGIDKWFAPPHLVYLNYDPKETGLENRRILISDVVDFGNRVGGARDRGDGDTRSGFICSLKIGAIDSAVKDYKSYRPDGLLDVLTSENLTLSNIEGIYDSSFLHNIYPGVRFPAAQYKRITFENLTLVDKASETKMMPIGGSDDPNNTQITFTNANVRVNRWSGSGTIRSRFAGGDNHVDINYASLK